MCYIVLANGHRVQEVVLLVIDRSEKAVVDGFNNLLAGYIYFSFRFLVAPSQIATSSYFFSGINLNAASTVISEYAFLFSFRRSCLSGIRHFVMKTMRLYCRKRRQIYIVHLILSIQRLRSSPIPS